MNDDRVAVPFSVMALTVPAVEAAMGKNWLPTLILALACFLLCTWMSVQEEPNWKWLRWAKSVVLLLLLTWTLGRTHSCWPGKGAEWIVPGGLLLLALYGAWKRSAMRGSSVLRYGMYLILGSMAILGIRLIKVENLKPVPALPDLQLAVILLLPLLAGRNGKWMYHPVGVIAVISSIVTGSCTSLYEYSRGLSMGSSGVQMESLAACAITVGNFALICYLLDAISRLQGKGSVWVWGVGAFLLYVAGVGMRPEAYVTALILLWVIIPSLGMTKIKRKKNEKSA